jgi:hypothetical protein
MVAVLLFTGLFREKVSGLATLVSPEPDHGLGLID